jgi:hypothetical protein
MEYDGRAQFKIPKFLTTDNITEKKISPGKRDL